jgi:pimeloyl-ACP methyl ester carboxylesterase
LPEARLKSGTIAYEDSGAGPTLLFVHGVFANSKLWSKVIPLLSDRYRCIAPDWPLGAHSIPIGSELSPSVVVEMIGEFIEQLGLEDVTLVGNDTGGALCQMFVVRHPGVVKRLVLTNCDAYDKFPPQPFTYLTWVPKVPGAISVLANSMRLHVNRRLPIAYGWLSKTMSREVEESFVNPVINDKGVRADIAGFLRRADKNELAATSAQYGSIDIPVKLVWAEGDRAFKVDLAERMVRELPNAELVRIPSKYTFVPLDEPERLAAEI